ncbi:hypothetical protein CEXT_156181 [Caerostris extrusa]|uniref:Uncharacterized protein n=1 Tax=Caerostris extrusa TaxID=172846 RepID=A0AAV4Y471_CAEEX|nr:hypothetical protein CEXT_156181 [Caerostris extrusa]
MFQVSGSLHPLQQIVCEKNQRPVSSCAIAVMKTVSQQLALLWREMSSFVMIVSKPRLKMHRQGSQTKLSDAK